MGGFEHYEVLDTTPVMEKIASHKFKKNGKSINIYYRNRPIEGVPDCDRICLEMRHSKTKFNRIFMRADEAVLILKLLSEGVYKAVSAYKWGLLE